MEKIDQILDSLYDRVIEPMEAKEQLLDLFAVINWVAFDFYKLETRPSKYGKYSITRKDGACAFWCRVAGRSSAAS